MRMILETPTKLRFHDVSEAEFTGLQNMLKYKDKTIEEQLRRVKNNPYFVMRYGEEAFQKQIEDLSSKLYKSLLLEDPDGIYTLPGMVKKIQMNFPDSTYENHVSYPDFKLIPWEREPSYDPYGFQKDAMEALLANPHSHIEVATGLGKTYIAALLAKNTGLPIIISTITQNLAKSFYRDLCEMFGKRNVGMLGAGKKEIGKHILVAVGKSLSMVEDQENIDKFKKYQVFISDESHTLPASQFNYFTHTVLGHCPYRWFLSATQERNDGKDLLLEGIIGPRVYEMTIQEGIKQGYLAKIDTLVFDVTSSSSYYNSVNTVKMNQQHFYGNDQILDIIGKMVPQALENGMPVLILIDEHEQELLLRRKLGNIYSYAKGGADASGICRDFNAGKVTCVVGTSAVSTGTNFKPVRLTINWQAGKAETKFKQGAIGRSTRIDAETGKKDCKIVDFRVTNVQMMYRHANARIKLYREVGPVNIAEYKE